MRGQRPAGPSRASLDRRLLADREYEIELGRVRRTELELAFRADLAHIAAVNAKTMAARKSNGFIEKRLVGARTGVADLRSLSENAAT
jgi:hypothetical protein